MKRHLSILACLVLVVAMVCTLASCNLFPNNNKPDEHTHSFVEGKCECGESDPDYVAPHTHNFVEGKCECGESDPDYVPVVPECEHASYSYEITKEATCTEAGEKTFTCTECGHSYTQEVEPAGHVAKTVAGTAPTCTETGLSNGKVCEVCGDTIVAQNVISATGHSFADGFCSVCGEADPDYNGPKTYVLDVQTLTAFAAGAKADGASEVIADFFTIYYSAKTKIDTTKNKTWPDGYTFAEGLRLNWGGTTAVNDDIKDDAGEVIGYVTKNAIEIVVDGTATVKVWWICGGDGREMGIFDANGDLVVASETNDVFTEGTEGVGAGKNGVYLSELAISNAGTYYIGTDNTNAIKNGGNIICKVEVTVTPAEEVQVQGNGTQDSPFVLPVAGDYTCAYPGGYDLVYYSYTVNSNCYVTVSSNWSGNTWLKIGTDIYNLSSTNDGNGQPVKVLAFAGSTVYFGVADWDEQAAEIPFNVSVEEVTFGSWDHLVGSWKGNITAFWSAIGYTITINADGTGNINENGGYYSTDYAISNIAVIGNTIIFTAADEWGNAPACYTFTYDAESNTLVADGGTLYVDDGSGTPVNPDVSYETVITSGSNTLYFSSAEVEADAATRKLTITVAGNYKFASGNLFVSGIVDSNGNAIAKNEDYTYTLVEGEYTVSFSMLSMFGVIADNGCELNVTVAEEVDPGTGDDDEEYPEFQFDALKDAILGWYDFDGYSIGIYESYMIGTYLANVYGEGYDLYFTFDVTVNEDGSSTLTLYHYYVDYESNPDMIETVLGYNIVIGGTSEDEPVDATDITTLPGTGSSADPFVITESDNYFLTNVNSYPGYLVSFGSSVEITVTIKADLAELYSKSWSTKYAEEGAEYTFTVKAGETLTMWVVMESGTADKVVINVTIDGEGAGTPDVDDEQAAANATLNGTYAYQPEEGLAFIVNFNNGLITVVRDDLGLGLPESFEYNYSPMMGSISTEYGYFYVDVTTGDLYYGRGWLLAPYTGEGEDPVVPSNPVLVVGDNTVSVTDTWNGTTVVLSATEAVTYVIAPGANAVVVYDYSNYFEGDKLEIALAAGESVELIVLTENWETGDVVVNVSEKAEVPGGDIPEGVESIDLTFTAPKAWSKTEEQSFIAGVAGEYTITATGYDAIVKTYLQYYDAEADSWTRIDTELPYTITLSAGQELKFRLYGWDNADEGKEIVVHIFTTAGSEPAGCEHNNVSNTIVGTTCTTNGSYTTTCDDCGEVLFSETTPATGHDYDNIVTAPTCTTAGYTEHICAICDDTYTDSEVEALGHADDNADYKCDACSTKMLPADGEALTIPQALAIAKLHDHNTYTTEKYYITGIIKSVYNTTYGNLYLVDADGNEITIYGLYSADGKTRYDAMSYKPVAGDELTVYTVLGMYNTTAQGKNAWMDEVVAHDHNYVSTVIAPTCTAGGYTNSVCSICNDVKKSDEVDALGHTTESGTCERCGSVVGDGTFETILPSNLSCNAANKADADAYMKTNYADWTITGKLGQTYAGYIGFGRSGDATSSIKSSAISVNSAFTVTAVLKGNGSSGVATSTLTFTLVDGEGNVVATGYANGSDVAAITPVDAKDTTYNISFTFVEGKTWTDVSNLVISFKKNTGNIGLKTLTFVQ